MNPDTYLRDETGNRRFWPVRCGTIDIDALARDRDQLWAEAVARFRAGAIWWLDTPELIAAATAEQEKRYQADAWDDLIEHWLTHETRNVGGEYPGYGAPTMESVPRAAPLTSVSVGEVLEHAIGIAPAFWTQKDQNRVSAYLKRNGWVRRMCREPGGRTAKRAWRYEKAGGRQEDGSANRVSRAGDEHQCASHSSSFDQRLRPEAFLTAMATALGWPTSTTSCLPRVTPV